MAAPLAASWHTVSPCNKKHTSLSSMTISATLVADLDVCSSSRYSFKHVLLELCLQLGVYARAFLLMIIYLLSSGSSSSYNAPAKMMDV
jgi:hypothetical protein